MGNNRSLCVFKRYTFDALVTDLIISFLQPADYLMLSRRHRLMALKAYPNKTKLFDYIISSEYDRDDILATLFGYNHEYIVPVTLSNRYWNKYCGRISNLDEVAVHFTNRMVKYRAFLHMIRNDTYQDQLDTIINISADNGWTDIISLCITSDNLQQILPTILYYPNTYLYRIHKYQLQAALSYIVCRRFIYDNDKAVTLYHYINKHYPSLITYEMRAAYNDLIEMLHDTLRNAIKENHRLTAKRHMPSSKYHKRTSITESTYDAYQDLKSKIEDVKWHNSRIR